MEVSYILQSTISHLPLSMKDDLIVISGAKTEVLFKGKTTPLEQAALRSHRECVQTLLQYGAQYDNQKTTGDPENLKKVRYVMMSSDVYSLYTVGKLCIRRKGSLCGVWWLITMCYFSASTTITWSLPMISWPTSYWVDSKAIKMMWVAENSHRTDWNFRLRACRFIMIACIRGLWIKQLYVGISMWVSDETWIDVKQTAEIVDIMKGHTEVWRHRCRWVMR